MKTALGFLTLIVAGAATITACGDGTNTATTGSGGQTTTASSSGSGGEGGTSMTGGSGGMPSTGGSGGTASTGGSGGGGSASKDVRGIYFLGDDKPPKATDMAHPFIDGFTMRVGWTALETSKDVYDFSGIDAVVAAIPAGKKLTLEIFIFDVPAYIKSEPGIETWMTTHPNGMVITTAVPWSTYAIQRYAALNTALANHVVEGVKLGDATSKLANVNASVVGLQGIRDIGSNLKDVPGYERTKFADGVIAGLHAAADAFPNKAPFVAFFGMADNILQPNLGDYLLERIRTEFYNGSGPSRMGLFQENLACDTPGPNGALYTERDKTYTMFQALRSWVKPANGNLMLIEKTDKCMMPAGCVKDTNGDGMADDRSTCTSGPDVGMQFAWDTFNTRYFEIYRDDVNHPGFATSLQAFHDKLWQ